MRLPAIGRDQATSMLLLRRTADNSITWQLELRDPLVCSQQSADAGRVSPSSAEYVANFVRNTFHLRPMPAGAPVRCSAGTVRAQPVLVLLPGRQSWALRRAIRLPVSNSINDGWQERVKAAAAAVRLRTLRQQQQHSWRPHPVSLFSVQQWPELRGSLCIGTGISALACGGGSGPNGPSNGAGGGGGGGDGWGAANPGNSGGAHVLSDVAAVNDPATPEASEDVVLLDVGGALTAQLICSVFGAVHLLLLLQLLLLLPDA